MKMNRRTFVRTTGAAALGLAVADPAVRRIIAAERITSDSGIPERVLGKTNRKVSIIGLGGWHIGRLKSDADAQDIVSRALDLGITFFDTAPSYQDGVSETRYGKALKGRRDTIFLMSKTTMRTKSDARSELEASLRRLQTEYLDLWQLHSIKSNEDVEQIFGPAGAYETAARAKEEGKIRHIGITGHFDPAVNLEALKYHELLETMQMPINLVDPHSSSFIKNVLPKATEHGLGVIAMKTIANGRIVEHQVASAQQCLSFVWNLPVSLIVSGVDSLAQLNENVAAARSLRKHTHEEQSLLLAMAEKTDFSAIEYYKKPIK